MMNPTLRDTPTWTVAPVIEGLTAFYRSILGQTYDALHVFFFAASAMRCHAMICSLSGC
jgi:hypothetical protein